MIRGLVDGSATVDWLATGGQSEPLGEALTAPSPLAAGSTFRGSWQMLGRDAGPGEACSAHAPMPFLGSAAALTSDQSCAARPECLAAPTSVGHNGGLGQLVTIRSANRTAALQVPGYWLASGSFEADGTGAS